MESSLINNVLERIDKTKSDLIKFLSDSIKFKSINPEMIDENVSKLKEYQEWTQKESCEYSL